jgi:acyl-CoA thioesterase-1
MLNHFLYHLASGQAWFSCGLLVLIIILLDMLQASDAHRVLGRIALLLLWLAILLAAVTSTPMPIWLAVPLAICCLGYLILGFSHPVRRRRVILGGAWAIMVLLAMGMELPFHLTTPPQAQPPHRLYVVADSLAAGLGREQTTWPKLLAARTGIEICDLSFAGANTHYALRSVKPVLDSEKDTGAWVLISIGGNDMLGKTSAMDFENELDQLLVVARGDPARPRTVLMQELPLIPGAWVFGAIQRRLASRHGVIFIPKRLLASVVLTEANVVDGLHLSPAGHERMAELLMRWMGHQRVHADVEDKRVTK